MIDNVSMELDGVRCPIITADEIKNEIDDCRKKNGALPKKIVFRRDVILRFGPSIDELVFMWMQDEGDNVGTLFGIPCIVGETLLPWKLA